MATSDTLSLLRKALAAIGADDARVEKMALRCLVKLNVTEADEEQILQKMKTTIRAANVFDASEEQFGDFVADVANGAGGAAIVAAAAQLAQSLYDADDIASILNTSILAAVSAQLKSIDFIMKNDALKKFVDRAKKPKKKAAAAQAAEESLTDAQILAEIGKIISKKKN